jgi:hypothetical protein
MYVADSLSFALHRVGREGPDVAWNWAIVPQFPLWAM